MKALIQRVTHGSVSVDGESVGAVGRGFVVLLGVYVCDCVGGRKPLVCAV